MHQDGLTLAALPLETEYRSDTHDLVRDFYLPCLERSKLYRRAVGYFTSRGLSVAAQGITALIQGGGRMLLVASPLFDADDLEAIQEGYLARDDMMLRSLLRQIESTPDSIVKDRLGFLAWLVAEDRLEIRIAIPEDAEGTPTGGIYHEKLGIFSDDLDNAVVFTGSPNETSGGLVDNFEATDVFCSWKDEEGRVPRKLANFDRLWNDQTPRLSVNPFPDLARQQLLRYRPKSCPPRESTVSIPTPTPRSEFPRDLWPHQVEAIQSWEGNDRAGVVSMATGCGKTRAALAAAERCDGLAVLVVAVPRMALVEQWRDELARHTRFPRAILAYESASGWQEPLFNKLRAARRQPTDWPVVVVGTLDTLSGQRFESVLADSGLSGNALLIVDEVHNVGAPTYRRTLRPEFNWRLGLSATPARYFDEEGSTAIREYFGATVFTYDMRRALEDGHLCPYRYFVYAAYLDDDEYEEYTRLTRRITQMRSAGYSEFAYHTDNSIDGDSAEVKQLLFRRSRILKRCGAKLDALHQALHDHPMTRGLIYCADNGQLQEVTALLSRGQVVYLTYTAETPTQHRRSALRALGAGHVAVIVAIDCLDEGVDVPTVDQAVIIASSCNKRQFIQRRGRILRKSPGKSLATLVDVIALPPLTAGPEARRMLKGELARVREMADLALNRHDALLAVKAYAAPYGVMLTELLSGEGDG